MSLPPILDDKELEDWKQLRASTATSTPKLESVVRALPPPPITLWTPPPSLPTSTGGTTAPSAPAPSEGRPPSVLTPGGVNQFGDKTMSWDAMLAACGPSAAISFYQATGRNMTVGEATRIAEENNLKAPNGGMYGPDAQQKLLSMMGVPTRREDGVNWANVQQDTANGNPVILSSPGAEGHYWQVYGYRP